MNLFQSNLRGSPSNQRRKINTGVIFVRTAVRLVSWVGDFLGILRNFASFHHHLKGTTIFSPCPPKKRPAIVTTMIFIHIFLKPALVSGVWPFTRWVSGYPFRFRWILPCERLVGKDDAHSSPTSTTTEPDRGREWHNEGRRTKSGTQETNRWKRQHRSLRWCFFPQKTRCKWKI